MNPRSESLYLRESADLNAVRSPAAAAFFLISIGATGLIELAYRPEVLPVWWRFFVIEAIAIITPVAMRPVLLRVRLFEPVVLLSWITAIALVHAYAYVTGMSPTVIATGTVCFTAAAALLSAWSVMSQAIMALSGSIAFIALLIARQQGGPDAIYSILAVVAGGLISIQGTRYMDLQRRAIFREAVRSENETSISTALEGLARKLNRGLGDDGQIDRIANLVRTLFDGAPWVLVVQRSDDDEQLRVTGGDGKLLTSIDNLKVIDISALADLISKTSHRDIDEIEDWEQMSLAMFNRKWGKTATVARLFHAEQVIGALIVGVKLSGEQQSRLLSGAAQHVAIALTNSALLEELRQASVLKSEFLATMSHELRTPLHVIIGYTEMLADIANERGDEELSQLIVRLMQNEGALTELIEGTLNANRIEVGSSTPRRLRFDVKRLFEQIRTDIRWLPRAPGVAVEWEVPSKPVTIYSDPEKIKIIAKNLIGNSLKFTKTGAVHVAACVRRDEQQLEIRVTDSGPGFPEKDLPHIFEMFRQSDTPTQETALSGVGLGLYIVREYVDRLGGTVRAENLEGGGADLLVRLPVQDTAKGKSRMVA